MNPSSPESGQPDSNGLVSILIRCYVQTKQASAKVICAQASAKVNKARAGRTSLSRPRPRRTPAPGAPLSPARARAARLRPPSAVLGGRMRGAGGRTRGAGRAADARCRRTRWAGRADGRAGRADALGGAGGAVRAADARCGAGGRAGRAADQVGAGGRAERGGRTRWAGRRHSALREASGTVTVSTVRRYGQVM